MHSMNTESLAGLVDTKLSSTVSVFTLVKCIHLIDIDPRYRPPLSHEKVGSQCTSFAHIIPLTPFVDVLLVNIA